MRRKLARSTYKCSFLGFIVLFATNCHFGGPTISIDPTEKHLPKNTSKVVYSFFTPEFIKHLENTPVCEVEEIGIDLGFVLIPFDAQGICWPGPFGNRVEVVTQEGQVDTALLVHELSHEAWMRYTLPDHGQFDRALERLMSDTNYLALATLVRSDWASRVERGYISLLYSTEMYSYIATVLACDSPRSIPVPQYIVDCYKGVLNDMFLRVDPYKRATLKPQSVMMWTGKQVINLVDVTLPQQIAIHNYGAIVQKEEDSEEYTLVLIGSYLNETHADETQLYIPPFNKLHIIAQLR